MSGSVLDGGLLWLHLHGSRNYRWQPDLCSLKSSFFFWDFTGLLPTGLDNSGIR